MRFYYLIEFIIFLFLPLILYIIPGIFVSKYAFWSVGNLHNLFGLETTVVEVQPKTAQFEREQDAMTLYNDYLYRLYFLTC